MEYVIITLLHIYWRLCSELFKKNWLRLDKNYWHKFVVFFGECGGGHSAEMVSIQKQNCDRFGTVQ